MEANWNMPVCALEVDSHENIFQCEHLAPVYHDAVLTT